MTRDHDPRADDGAHAPDPDEVERLLADVLAGRLRPDEVDDPAVAALLRVRALAAEPVPTTSRDRHLVRIRTHTPAGGTVPVPASGRGRRRLRALVAAATALLLVTGGSAVAVAQDASPDDALYPLKRTSEQVWLGLPRGQERAADVHLALADRRLEEVTRAPAHAERLIAEGVDNVEAASEERPEEALASFERLLGAGEERLPDQASPVARAALHRNCVRLAGRHGLDEDRCGAAPAVAHPGRGRGGAADDRPGGGPPPGRGLGPSGDDRPRGWGPGGRPDGVEGAPPGTPGHGRADADDEEG